MRIHPIPLMTGLLLSSLTAFSQQDPPFTLQLRSAKFIPERNITAETVNRFTQRLQKVNGKSFAVIQFEKIPSDLQKKELSAAGIWLLEYIPDRAYTASISRPLDFALLQRVNARSLLELTPQQKMHPVMAKGVYPSWAVKTPGMMDVWVSFPGTISFEEIKKLLQEKNISITSTDYKEYHVIGLQVALQRIVEVASLPFIEYIEPAPRGDQVLNYESRNDTRGNILNASAAVGGYDLKGEDITAGVGDDADPQYHVDFTGRLINFGPAGYTPHGTHVHGTVGGGGIGNEIGVGYAPRATLVTQYLSGIIKNASVYVTDYNMVVTNNSYGDVLGDCSYMGFYDLQSRILDLQAASLPNLQHVFAVGNDGGLTCAPYPASFRTVLSGYQSAKNVLTVGATQRSGAITTFSSRGPVKDGRTKPEITADGLFTLSSGPDDIYWNIQGTSMAAPAITGGLALLYQRYRQLNGGTDPKNGLMKSLICNGGYDFGNAGPDFTNGFGRMNLLRSIEMLNNTWYLTSSISNGGNNPHTISVPAGTAQLKVMLYWTDPAAAVLASPSLVNDLDLELATPAPPVTVLPFKLDTIPANVNNTATTAADHMNNIEQAVITNPGSGTYTVTVKGTSVPTGPQEYFVVFDIIPTETRIVYPIGGEGLNPTETVTIQWESYGDPANTFFVEYSTNNGGSWTTIDAAVAANLRQLTWVVPSVQTDQALVRVTRNGTGFISTSNSFTIIGVPAVTLAATQCEGYFAFDWSPVTGATDYEVFQLQGTEMVSIATTGATTYTLSGLSPSVEYWVTVCARFNGKRGRKAPALKRTPATGTCTGSISNNDIRMDSITAPVYGRIGTSTALTATTSVLARIKNLDDANVTSFNMLYSVNGIPVANEPVTATIVPGATYTHTFATTYNFSGAGNYILRAEVQNTTGVDPVTVNNSLTDTIRQLSNIAIPLPFTDNIEAATARLYYKPRFGVEGIDRYDFTNTDPLGRLSTFLSTGMAYSGTKSLMMDLDGWNGGVGSVNFIYGTYNLNGLNAATNDIRLDFQFKSHGDSVVNANNKVWIRGDDGQSWILAYNLNSNSNEPGIFKKTPSIELSDLLTAAGQNYTTSFQVRWGQFGLQRIMDNEGIVGHNIDDIRLYEAIDDIQLISIDTPIVNSCGLNSTVPVKVTVRNASPNALSNIPISFTVDGGAPVIENMAGPIAANASIPYTFTATANLAALGTHTVFVDINYPTDNFPDNDTATVILINTPVINTFPHLENFESNNGNWYSGGKNNSWAYGIPVSTKINRAASGTKAWKTNLSGAYNNKEASYLYSPCYDISSMTNPTLSMSIALDLEDCGGVFCDGAYVEYSADGRTWNRLGNAGTGTNWYNKNYGGGNVLWSVQDYTRWHVATTPLPTGISKLRLRIVVTADPFVTFEGIAIDDIHVYDNTTGIYDGVTMGSPVTQNITGGTSWIDFVSGGKLVASIQPNNQNMGNTDVQAYINTGGVRNDALQYYHDRNITIKPTTVALADSAVVRFYFLDTETEALINATGCAVCTKPSMAAELGVTKYSDPDDNFENGNLADDVQGTFNFHNADWNYKVPFDKGYYVEFRVKDFSEFWLNNGGPDKLTPLPVELISFTAKKKNNKDVLAEWKTASEQNVNRFEIEVAKGNENYLQRRFVKIGEVLSPGNTTTERSYNFMDTENGKTGVRYYRLKIVDNDNTFVYSPVRPVVFNQELQWQVYPNPSAGAFNLVYQLNEGEMMNIKVYDASGRLVKQLNPGGNGFIQKTVIDLQGTKYASGIYLVQVETEGKKQSFRILKQ